MPEIKLYMIVTNDEYETPVATDLKGAKSVAEYLGLSVNTVRDKLCRNNWSKKAKYKAVVTGVYEFDKNGYTKKYSMTHDRSEYYKQYRQEHREELNGYLKDYRRRIKNESAC